MSELGMQPNGIYCGDCLGTLQRYVPTESVDLVYMDPPFGSDETYEVIYKDGVEVRHFQDRWVGGKQGYLNWIEPRLRECHRILKETGSFYLHCDDHLNGYLRTLLDIIFGDGNFRNEIIWKRSSAHSDTKQGRAALGRIHDTILFYTKSAQWTWNPKRAKYDQHYIDTHYKKAEGPNGEIITLKPGEPLPDGYRRFTDSDLTARKPGGDTSYDWKGVKPYGGRFWAYSKVNMEEFEKQGRLLYAKGGMPRLKHYFDEMEGTPLQDLWTDIAPLNAKASERQGFPTQKPTELLERIIELSTNPGDLVLDPVCGCGTTIVAAKAQKRNWIGIDISPTACRLVAKRVGLPTGLIADLPRSMADVKEMMTLDPTGIEFQNWVCDLLGAVSTTKRGSAPRPDGGIDGWILSMTPISVKGSEAIGRPVVDKFETNIRKVRKKEGLIVAFSFSSHAFEEAQRARREEGLDVDLLEVRERVEPVEGAAPEISTYLYSEITKRTWGDKAAGPAPPPPLMVPIQPVKRVRVKKLTEQPAEPSPPQDLKRNGLRE